MKKIIVAPLDWGLGHATRCIPVINELQEQGACVVVVSNGRALELLKKEFPCLAYFDVPGYDIKYPENGNMMGKIILSVPKIASRIRKEHKKLNEIIEKEDIDGVISDNRYGLWSDKVYSVFMTHQLYIKSPKGVSMLDPLIYKLNKRYISKFDECWVPDMEGDINLSGELSHKNDAALNTSFIGPLSRFRKHKDIEQNDFIYDLIAIISGPEPQRSLF